MTFTHVHPVSMCFCFACFLFHPQHFSPTKSWDELHIGLLWLIESLGIYSTPVSRAVDHWIFLAMVATTSIVPRQQTWAGRGAELNSNSIRSKLEWTYPYSIEASLDIETHLLSWMVFFSSHLSVVFNTETSGYRCFGCLGPSQLNPTKNSTIQLTNQSWRLHHPTKRTKKPRLFQEWWSP